jgi:hypothetical protein
MLDAVTLDTFAPLVGQTFRLFLDDGAALEAVLRSATPAPFPGWQPPDGAPRREPFALTFMVPVQFVLPQRIYRFERDGLGELEIFVVPIEQTAEGVLYEAVFA